MILQQMTFYGFRSFREEFVLTFDAGPLFLFGRNKQYPEKFGSNGSGKSTLVMALCWCLTGRLPSKVPKDDVINRQSDEAFVEAVFDTLTVRRSKKRGYAESLYWKTADGREGKGDLPTVSRDLTEILGVDNALFFNSMWIDGESKTVQFLFAQDAERMEILEGLLAQNLFSSARKLASDACTESKRREAKHESEATSRQAEYEKESGRYERAIAALAEYDERVATAEARRDERAAEIRIEVKDARKSAAAQGELLAQRDAAQEEVTVLERQEMALTKEVATLEADAKTFQRIIRLPAGEPCPTCGQDITDECAGPAMRSLKEVGLKQHEIEQRHRAIRRLLQEAREKRAACGQAEPILRALRQTLKRLSEEAARLSSAVDYGSREALYAAVAESKKNLLVLETGILAAKDALASAKTDIAVWAFWVEGFGSKGLRTIMLDKVRAMMQHHVDLYTKRLAGDAFSVKFPPSKSGFAIVLETAEGPASVETFSKGEVWRANIAVLLSLRKVLQYMKATPLNFLVLDDPCSGSVDDVGVDNIVETIIAISDEFDQVFCTLPKEVAVPYDRALMVVKDVEGFSEVAAYTA